MTMPIYVPSLGRTKKKELDAGPLPQVPASLIYVVPEAEVDTYSAALPDNRVISCPEVGIAATRRWIGEHANGEGHPKFFMIDDDIRFLIRISPEVWNLREATSSEVGSMLELVTKLLDEYGHVGVSAREGQSHLGLGHILSVNENTRTLRALAYRTKDFLSVEHGRVQVMEDFDVNLQLLRKGIPNANTIYFAQGQKMTNADGGCSTYRSHQVHEESAHKLAELHHPFVKTRQKQNKTDSDGFGTRTEVTIQWKKAFASSGGK